MKVGSRFELHGQRYFCVGTKAHETSYGRHLTLLVLESDCPECGATFRLMATKTNIRHRVLTRRCEDCRRPGVPVDPRRRASAPLAAAKQTKRRRLSKRRKQRLQIAREASECRKSRSVDNAALPVVNVPAPSTAAIEASSDLRDTYLRALSMLDD